MLFVVAAIGFFIVYRKIHFEVNVIASGKNQIQSEYSIFITNIPTILRNFENIYEERLEECCTNIIKEWIQENKNSREPSELYLEYLRADSLKENHPKNRSDKKIIYSHLCWDISEIQEINTNKTLILDQVEAMAQNITDSEGHKPSFDIAVKKFKDKMPALKQQWREVDSELL